jgi:hydroxyethylthiazole kinase
VIGTGAERQDANPSNLIRVIPAEGSGAMAQDTAFTSERASLVGHNIVAGRVWTILEAIRAGGLKVHAITSPVAQTITANGLLALGVAPSLTVNAEELDYFASTSQAMLLNLGMLDRDRFEVLPLAARAANAAGLPLVIDPVFADRSARRRALARELFASGASIVKMNAIEADAFARHIPAEAVSVVTGPVDRITQGRREARLANGHALMGRVTGTGCMLGAVLAACLAVSPDPFESAIAGVSILNIAAEIAADGAAGPGTFAPRLLDAMHALSADAIDARLKLEMVRDAER